MRFFFVSAASSIPRGEPWHDSVPALFGDPKPMTVLQDITVGLLDLDALEIVLEIFLVLLKVVLNLFYLILILNNF